MFIFQKGIVKNNKLIVQEEAYVSASQKELLIKKLFSLKLKGNEAAVVFEKDGGILRKGYFFNINTLKSII